METVYGLLARYGLHAARYLPAVSLTAVVTSGLIVAQTTPRSGLYMGDGDRALDARGYGWPACDMTRTDVGTYSFIPAGTLPAVTRSHWHGGGLALNIAVCVVLLAATSFSGVKLGRRLLASPRYHLREILAGTAVVAVLIVLWQRERDVYALFGAAYPHVAHATLGLPWYAAMPIYLGIGCVLVMLWRGARWCVGRRAP